MESNEDELFWRGRSQENRIVWFFRLVVAVVVGYVVRWLSE
jgi:hypothetical protein